MCNAVWLEYNASLKLINTLQLVKDNNWSSRRTINRPTYRSYLDMLKVKSFNIYHVFLRAVSISVSRQCAELHKLLLKKVLSIIQDPTLLQNLDIRRVECQISKPRGIDRSSIYLCRAFLNYCSLYTFNFLSFVQTFGSYLLPGWPKLVPLLAMPFWHYFPSFMERM